MIANFYNSDIDHSTYIKLYTKLKKAIGEFEENDEKAKVAGIYYIFNQNDELMYIGQSKNIASRLTTHIRGKYRNSSKIIIEPVDISELDAVERFLIDILKPIDNIMVNEKYCIEDTNWSEQFLCLDDDEKEYCDFSNIKLYVTNNPRTIIYPTLLTVFSIDFLPELHSFLSKVDEIDPDIINRVMAHIGGIK